MMISFASIVWHVAAFRLFIQLIFKRRINEKLSQEHHGIIFTNPVGLAAGFDKDGEIIPAISALGFGFGTVGSVTAKQCVGNPRPWFYRLPNTQSTVVHAGLPNDGSKTIINRISKYPKNSIKHFPVVLSVAKTNCCEVISIQDGINDYIATLKRAKNEKNIQIIELNISCPNAYGGEPFTTPDRLKRLLTAVDKVGLRQPVYIKMPVDLSWDKFKGLLDVIIKHKVVGVTISNLTKDRGKIKLKDILPDEVLGSFSGKPTWHLSNELIRKTFLLYGDKLTIIGLGGVFSADDAYVKIKLGASLIETITGVIFNGPQLAAEINDELIRLLKKDGYTHISQAIGVDAK